MSQSPIQAAIQQICQEKNLAEEAVLRTVELALAAAYRKDFGNKLQNIVAEFDPKTGGVKVFDVKTVVEDLPEEELAALAAAAEQQEEAPAIKAIVETENAFVAEGEEEPIKKFNPKNEVQLKDARLISEEYKIGDEIVTPLDVPGEFGRMAAQTAKQVIIQKLREVERQNIFEEYKDSQGQAVVGTIQRREGRNVLVELGHAIALMLPEDQIERERYNVGNRLKFYIRLVEMTTRGPQILVSRTHPELARKIFEMEIPEIASGAIEIKAIAREAGGRSKVAVFTDDENIDPIGSCVGQRGARIQTVISELGNEKVDIILWDEDVVKFITNALSPAKTVAVELKEEGEQKIAVVTVKEDQLSLAIGKGGQNVRLASKLTGWKIDIISEAGVKVEAGEEGAEATEAVSTEEVKEEAVETAEAEAAPVEEVKEEVAEDGEVEKAEIVPVEEVKTE